MPPNDSDIQFEDLSSAYGGEGDSVTDPTNEVTAETPSKPFPEAIIELSEESSEKLTSWLDEQIQILESAQAPKLAEFAIQESDYRARSLGPQSYPFEGASGDIVPAIAMAVDPIHARLDTGIFKADRVYTFKPIRKSATDYVESLELFVQHYVKNKLKLRQVVNPRLLELCKHGTMVLKVIYDCDKYSIMSYDKSWNVVKKEVTRFKGPRIVGVNLADFLFPPNYQHLQQCPIVVEKIRTSLGELKIAEASGKLKNVDKIKDQTTNETNDLLDAREIAANHSDPLLRLEQLVLHEVWFDYDINNDGIPERLVCTYHKDTKTILQLRYNFYFHQRKPYVLIPYTVVNDSLYGLGLCEMTKPFQDMLTAWQRLSHDNAYLANIRMFAVQKNAPIEEKLKVFSGKQIRVDDPSKDIRELKLSDTYASTLTERQNLFALAEKRHGLSDYLAGRESAVAGSASTATSTLALIQEGTRRVEEVLENIRVGMAEALEMCFFIWKQYGTDDIEDIIFGTDDDIASDVKDFFDSTSEENLDGALAIDLAATDASNNRSVKQQTQLSIIQTMMGYLEKVLVMGQQALQAQTTMPAYTEMVKEVMESARRMFKELLTTYDIRNAEQYLPSLENYLNGGVPAPIPGGPGGVGPGVEGLGVEPGIPSIQAPPFIPGGFGAEQIAGFIRPPGIGIPSGPDQGVP